MPRRSLALETTAALIFSLAALLATSPMLPMTWDEGNAILRSEHITRWLGEAFGRASVEGPAPWSPEGIRKGWPFTTQVEGHPAFYALVISIGRAVSGGFLPPLQAARFGPICLFSLAMAATYYRMRRQFGRSAAVVTVLALLGMPRLFAHAHLASFDGPLVACWLLSWALFEPACREKRWIVAWAAALGATLACKFTGWFAPLPLLAWAALYRDRGAARALAIGLPMACGIFYLLNPPLWLDPIDGLREFVFLNVTRRHFNISIFFLGRMYNLDHPLPWWNTLFWTSVAVPVGFLLLFAVGAWRVGKHWRREPRGTLLLANWAILMVVRALPIAPPHDGIRLFLPSFAFLAAITGIGFATLWDRRLADARPVERIRDRGDRARRTVAVALVASSLTSVFWYAPHWLSHYNVLMGGARGAAKAGMETTYYWDGLDRDVLAWLAAHTQADEKVCFASPSGENLYLMARWGDLRFRFHPRQPGTNRWYVIQCRASAWTAADRHLLRHGTPSFVKTVGRGGWGPWRLDVPLVLVYPYAQYEDASRAVQNSPAPPPVPRLY